ncbi:MAG: AraC family transcriptional regulator [Parvibaculum sp.]|uniref:helix-turn-helix transcriptional regulator n=1 Tax=Parvibaculum sp. TaxID=2024848 RepID=UPI00283DE64C|nr:AraC family transcriptional regulator [Parvibaculum sp.]MDR3498613.1 AraC family transcriptional regulator [Parvibaculum sp.]
MTKKRRSGNDTLRPVRGITVDGSAEDVRMDGVYFFRSSASYPFAKVLDPGDFSYCIMLRRGRMRLTMDFPAPRTIDMEPGDIVGISGLAPHLLHSMPRREDCPTTTFERHLISDRADQDSDVELIVGVAPSESIALSNMILGPVYIDPSSVPECSRRIWKSAELLEEEFRDTAQGYGHAIIVRRIAEIMLINLTRAILAERERGGGPSPGLMKSSGVLAAIRAFLDAPLDNWSLGSLARAAGMSRAKFADEFRRAMERTPMQALGRIRLTLIARKLVTEELSVDEAADIAGYSSSAAFIRAFNREFGATPFQWRKRQIGAPPDGQESQRRKRV